MIKNTKPDTCNIEKELSSLREYGIDVKAGSESLSIKRFLIHKREMVILFIIGIAFSTLMIIMHDSFPSTSVMITLICIQLAVFCGLPVYNILASAIYRLDFTNKQVTIVEFPRFWVTRRILFGEISNLEIEKSKHRNVYGLVTFKASILIKFKDGSSMNIAYLAAMDLNKVSSDSKMLLGIFEKIIDASKNKSEKNNIREAFGSLEHFEKFIKNSTQSIKLFEKRVKESKLKPKHRCQLLYAIFKGRLERLIAKYSYGTRVQNLKKEFPDLIKSLVRYHSEDKSEKFDLKDIDDYIRALCLVSFAIIFDSDKKDFQLLIDTIDQRGKDLTFDSLVSLKISGYRQTDMLLHPKPYKYLKDASNKSGQQQENLILQFLSNYYEGMKNTYWYDLHKNENLGFFGYWCFELTAFVKELKIDDSAFSNNTYYPGDLLHH